MESDKGVLWSLAYAGGGLVLREICASLAIVGYRFWRRLNSWLGRSMLHRWRGAAMGMDGGAVVGGGAGRVAGGVGRCMSDRSGYV